MSHLFRPKLPTLETLPWLFSACLFLFLFSSAVHSVPRADTPDKSPVFSKCWDYPATPDLRVSPVSDETSVYFLDNENKLVGVHLNGGTKLWSTDLGGDLASNLLIAGDSIFVVTSVAASSAPGAKAVLWSLSRQTGITDWRTDISPSPYVFLGRSSGSILALGSDGFVAAVGSKGEVIWKTELGSPLSSEPYFDDVGVAIGTAKNEVLSLAGSDGRRTVLWKSRHAPTAIYLNSRTRVLVGDERGNLFSLPAGASPSWRFRNGARISRVFSNNNGYLAVSDDNFVYNISRSGDVKWKRRLPGRVAGAPLILGDSLVVSVIGAGAVFVLDVRNGKVSNRIETGEDTSVGVAGRPDGEGFVITGVNRLTYFSRAKCPFK